jgi:hypothetical protein
MTLLAPAGASCSRMALLALLAWIFPARAVLALPEPLLAPARAGTIPCSRLLAPDQPGQPDPP